MDFVLILVFTLTLILFLNVYIFRSSNTKTKLPPGKTGWPIIGESLAFISNPATFIRDRMMKHSPEIFQTSIAGEAMVVLCGPAGNKFLFSSDDKLIRPWWPKSVTQTFLFESSYSQSVLDDHSFLKLDSVQHYVPIMDAIVIDHIESNWVPYDQIKVHPLAKEITFTIACKLFLNSVDDQVKTLTKPFFDVAKGILSVPINFPGTPFNGAVKGGAFIKEKLVEIIRQRKTELARHDDIKTWDLLSRLLLASDKNGKFYGEEEIANKITGYMIASFYTTSSTITFVLGHLADDPHVYDLVLKEQLEVVKMKKAGESLNWGDIQKMKYSWNVVCESMRIMPPAQGGFKEVLSDFSFAGFNISKGWKALWTVHSTNKDPKYYPDPEKFDPSRFEGSGPPPYTFVPFGGGPRMCAGKEYARIEILVFVHHVVTRFALKKVNQNEKITFNPEPILEEGLPMYLQPHKR